MVYSCMTSSVCAAQRTEPQPHRRPSAKYQNEIISFVFWLRFYFFYFSPCSTSSYRRHVYGSGFPFGTFHFDWVLDICFDIHMRRSLREQFAWNFHCVVCSVVDHWSRKFNSTIERHRTSQGKVNEEWKLVYRNMPHSYDAQRMPTTLKMMAISVRCCYGWLLFLISLLELVYIPRSEWRRRAKQRSRSYCRNDFARATERPRDRDRQHESSACTRKKLKPSPIAFSGGHVENKSKVPCPNGFAGVTLLNLARIAHQMKCVGYKSLQRQELIAHPNTIQLLPIPRFPIQLDSVLSNSFPICAGMLPQTPYTSSVATNTEYVFWPQKRENFSFSVSQSPISGKALRQFRTYN